MSLLLEQSSGRDRKESGTEIPILVKSILSIKYRFTKNKNKKYSLKNEEKSMLLSI